MTAANTMSTRTARRTSSLRRRLMGTALSCSLVTALAMAPAMADDSGPGASVILAGSLASSSPALEAPERTPLLDPALVRAAGGFAKGVLAGQAGPAAAETVDDSVDIVEEDPVVVTGDFAPAVLGVSYSGDVNIVVNDITTSGQFSDGVRALGLTAGKLIEINTTGGVITTTGDGSSGIVAEQLGTYSLGARSYVSVLHGDISTKGDFALGVDVTVMAGTTFIDGGDITTEGVGSTGVRALVTDSAYVFSGSIKTSGDDAIGVDIGGAGLSSGATVGAAFNESVSTSGDGAHGIRIAAQSLAFAYTGTVTTEGERADGIDVSAAFGRSVVSAGEVETSGDASVGIRAQGEQGVYIYSDSVVTTGASIETQTGGGGGGFGGPLGTGPAPGGSTIEASVGIFAESGSGLVYVDSGSVSTLGEQAHGIVGNSFLGDVTIVSQIVSTQGDGAVGIQSTVDYGDIRVTSGEVTTKGEDAYGVQLTSGGSIFLSSETITTSGDGAAALNLLTRTGEIEALTGSLTTYGDYAAGIFAIGESRGSDIDVVSTGAISTSGDYSSGIYIDTEGGVSVLAEDITTKGEESSGIYALAFGDILIDAGEISTEGTYAPAVNAVSYGGDIDIHLDGAETTGDGTRGINAYSFGGGISVDVDTVEVSGERPVITVFIDSPFTNPADDASGVLDPRDGFEDGFETKGAPVVGVMLQAFLGDAELISKSITVTGEGASGATVRSWTQAASARVDEVSISGAISDAGLEGLNVQGQAGASADVGTLSVIVTENLAEDYSAVTIRGISLGSLNGPVRLSIDSVDVQGGLRTTGVNLTAGYSFIEADIGEVSVTAEGGPGGVFARTVGLAGEATISSLRIGKITTSGDYLVGVRALATNWASNSIEVGEIVTDGAQSVGLFAASTGGTDISAGSIVTSGDAADGIQVINLPNLNGMLGPLPVALEAVLQELGPTDGGSPTALDLATTLFADDAADALLSAPSSLPGEIPVGDITIAVESVETTGDSSRGIAAWGLNDISITSGSVVTTGGSTTFWTFDLYENGIWNQDVPLYEKQGTASYGIEAISELGNISIESGFVSTLGAGAHGIRAITNGGVIDVLAGDIDVSGDGADGLHLISQTGDVSVTVAGDVLAENGAGVRVASSGEIDITIADGGVLRSADGGFAIVVEPGLVEELVIDQETTGGNATTTAGDGYSIVYTSITSGSSITVDEGGVLQGRVQLTSETDDLVVNGLFNASGTSLFGGGTDSLTNNGTVAIVNGTAAFDGLESFINNGLLTLADGAANDSINLSGIAFTGGDGSALAFDVLSDGSGGFDADSITFGDVTGVTEIRINGEEGLTLDAAVDLMTFNGTVASGAFTLAEDTADAGFMQWALSQSSTKLSLSATPDVEVFEVSRSASLATEHWMRGGEALRRQTASLRAQEPGDGWRLWVDHSNVSRESDPVTLSTQFNDDTVSFAVGRDHDVTLFSAGAAYEVGAWTLGATAGRTESESEFMTTMNLADLETTDLSAFAQWRSEGVFAGAYVRAADGTLDLNVETADETSEADVSMLGLGLEAGARFGGEGGYLEPSAALNWVSADIDRIAFSTGAFELDNATSLQAELGARFGRLWRLESVTVHPYGGVFYLAEMAGENSSVYTSGSASVALSDEAVGSYGRGEFGVEMWFNNAFAVGIGGEAYTGEQSGSALNLSARLRF